MRKRETSGPSWMRLVGLVKDGGLVRSRTSRVGPLRGADAMMAITPLCLAVFESTEISRRIKRSSGKGRWSWRMFLRKRVEGLDRRVGA